MIAAGLQRNDRLGFRKTIMEGTAGRHPVELAGCPLPHAARVSDKIDNLYALTQPPPRRDAVSPAGSVDARLKSATPGRTGS
jgi:hypothetical protein